MPGYLSLCIESWQRNIPDAQIIRINYDNLSGYSGGSVPLGPLKWFSYPQQSDIVKFAVMSKQTGLFLDADTIVFPGFDPAQFNIMGREGTLVLYGGRDCKSIEEAKDPRDLYGCDMNFFYTTQPQNPLLRACLEEANRRLQYQVTGLRMWKGWIRHRIRGKSAKVAWNYLGNQIIDPLILTGQHDEFFELRNSNERGYLPFDYPNKGFQERQGAMIEEYRALWWSADFPENELIKRAKDRIMALQNSWTPKEYKALDRSAVLQNPSLLSRVLRLACASPGMVQ